jgi:hypothetical protein
MSASFLPDLAMTPNSDDQEGAVGIFRDTLSQVVAGTCLVALGTCISMWATLQVLQQSITALVKNDTEQTQQINKLREEVIDIRVELGVQRVRVSHMARRFDAP